jgi:hypothetical protein
MGTEEPGPETEASESRAQRATEEDRMLDVHPPHEPIHGWRDFLLHLATITIGLFIALRLEGCVEWAHHKHLVYEARENLRNEIQENQRELRGVLAQLPKSEKEIEEDIVKLRQIRDKQPSSLHSLSYSFEGPTLRRSSWDTARDTGALSFMPYQEVKEYAEVYSVQALVEQLNAKLIDAETTGMGAVLAADDPEKLSPSEAETALQATSTIRSQLLVAGSIGRQLEKKYSRLLK